MKNSKGATGNGGDKVETKYFYGGGNPAEKLIKTVYFVIFFKAFLSFPVRHEKRTSPTLGDPLHQILCVVLEHSLHVFRSHGDFFGLYQHKPLCGGL